MVTTAARQVDSPEVEIGKAVLDFVMARLPGHVTKSLEPRLKEFRDVDIKGRWDDLFSRMLDVEKQMAEQKKLHDAQLKEMKKYYEDCLSNMRKTYEEGQRQTRIILQSLPVPKVENTVNIPKSAIEVKQLPSHVDVRVDVPKVQAPDVKIENIVKVDPTPVNVNVPEQKAPDVKVEVKPADVQVSVPPPRLVEKTFTYDAAGRPATVREEEIKD